MDGKSHQLYYRLFGDVIEKEFESAVCSFKQEFGVALRFSKKYYGFLDKEFRSAPVANKKRKYQLLSRNCKVRFNYSYESAVEADISVATDKETLTANEFLLLYWNLCVGRVFLLKNWRTFIHFKFLQLLNNRVH